MSVGAVDRGSLLCGRDRDGVTARVPRSLDQQRKLPDLGVGELLGWPLAHFHMQMLGELSEMKHVKDLAGTK